MRAWAGVESVAVAGCRCGSTAEGGMARHGSRRSGGRCDGVGVTVSGRVPGPKPPRFGNVVRIAFRAGRVAPPSPPANTGRTGRVHSGRAAPGRAGFEADQGAS